MKVQLIVLAIAGFFVVQLPVIAAYIPPCKSDATTYNGKTESSS